MPSATSGNLNSVMLVGEGLFYFFDEHVGIGSVKMFRAIVRDNHIRCRNPNDGCLKVVEAFFLDGGSQFSSKATGMNGFMDDDHPACFFSTFKDGFFVNLFCLKIK